MVQPSSPSALLRRALAGCLRLRAAWPAAACGRCQCWGPQLHIQHTTHHHQQQQQQQASFTTTTSTPAAADQPKDGSSPRPSRATRRRQRGADAHAARLPPGFGRVGSRLLRHDPERLERLRVICGFYDRVAPSQRPRHVTLSNLQTLQFLPDMDPYYKLSLLSYRSKLCNQDLLEPLRRTQAYLDRLAQQQSAFTPLIPGMLHATATAAAESAPAAAAEAAPPGGDGGGGSNSSSEGGGASSSSSSSSSSSNGES